MSDPEKAPDTPPVQIPIVVSSNPLRAGEPGILLQLPSSDLEKRYVHVKSILEDTGLIVEMVNAQSAPYNKRLLGKFIIVELLSFQVNARKLYNAIKQDRKLTPVAPTAKAAFDAVFQKYPSFATLRNKLAAHRDEDLDVPAAVALWDSMTITNLGEVLNGCYDFLNAIYQSNPRAFNPYNMDGYTLKGVFGVEGSGDRKPFAAP